MSVIPYILTYYVFYAIWAICMIYLGLKNSSVPNEILRTKRWVRICSNLSTMFFIIAIISIPIVFLALIWNF